MNINGTIITLQGPLNKRTVPQLAARQRRISATISQIDCHEVTELDSAGVAFLDGLLEQCGLDDSALTQLDASLVPTYQTFSSAAVPQAAPERVIPFFECLGAQAMDALNSMADSILLTADIAFWSVVGLFSNKSQRKGSVAQQSLLIGVDAIGIIGLLSLVLGLILALQSAAQLRQFGANIFVADLIAISMVREMGPMITAILLAGRSGSAIASEIASMKVSEEIDALKMMAINPIRYIVVPKFHAITICMPLLVTLSNVVGILGGLIIGVTYLQLSPISFMNEVFKVLVLRDIVISMAKSVMFAWVIVIIGSYYGFHVKGGAEGVGRATTNSVVASIFAIILLDAIFSLIFYF